MSRKPVTRLLWLDTETTGLVPGYHEVMQIGARISTTKGELLEPRIEVQQRIRYPERMEPGASDRHGVRSAHEWNERPDTKPSALWDFEEWLEMQAKDQRLLVAGWNIGFDERMLRGTPGGGIDLIRMRNFDYHMLDIWPIARLLIGEEASSLEACARYLGLEPPPHSGLADAELACRVWRELQHQLQEGQLPK